MVRIQCFNHMKLAVDLPKIAATMTKNYYYYYYYYYY